MPTNRGVIQLTINDTSYTDFSSVEENQWATVKDVLNDKYFIGHNGALLQGTGLVGQEMTITPGLTERTVNAATEKYFSKVKIKSIQSVFTGPEEVWNEIAQYFPSEAKISNLEE